MAAALPLKRPLGASSPQESSRQRRDGVGTAFVPRNVAAFGDAAIGANPAKRSLEARPSLLQQVKSGASGVGGDASVSDFLSRLQRATSPAGGAGAGAQWLNAPPPPTNGAGAQPAKAPKSHLSYSPDQPLPLDLSLKAKVRVSSPQPLPWVGALPDAREQARAVRRFVRGRAAHANDNDNAAAAAHTWRSAQLFFRLPAGSAPDAFRAALRSAYMATRTDECPRFYARADGFQLVLVGDAGGASDECGRPEPGAVLTGTSRSLRAQLRECGVEFWSPRDPTVGAAADEEEDAALQELRELDGGSSSHAQSRALVRAGSARGDLPVVVRGHESVHALYDWLLRTWGGSVSPHVGPAPELLCSAPFEHAAIARLPVSFSGTVRGDDGAPRHVLELEGPVLPEALAALLSAARTVDCEVALDALAGTADFTVPVRERENAERESGVRGGFTQTAVLRAVVSAVSAGVVDVHVTSSV